eukprot:UN17416
MADPRYYDPRFFLTQILFSPQYFLPQIFFHSN